MTRVVETRDLTAPPLVNSKSPALPQEPMPGGGLSLAIPKSLVLVLQALSRC